MRTHLLDGRRYILEKRHRTLATRDSSDTSSTFHHHIKSCHMGKTVIKRKDYKHHISPVDGNHRKRLIYIGGIVAMCKKYSFRIGGST